jgi:HSP20 family protein
MVAAINTVIFERRIVMALPTRVSRALATTSNPFDNMHREFDTMLNRFFNPEQSTTRILPYGVDIREDADHFYVEAELPGFKKDEVDVTLENATLTISAERNAETKEGGQKGESLLQERRWGRYVRSFTLPPTVDEQKVDAHLEHGVLTITLNKRDEVKPRKITVS